MTELTFRPIRERQLLDDYIYSTHVLTDSRNTYQKQYLTLHLHTLIPQVKVTRTRVGCTNVRPDEYRSGGISFRFWTRESGLKIWGPCFAGVEKVC